MSATERSRTVAAAVARDAVRVSGPDAETFLQGQLSQDVDSLAVNTSTWAFLLHPQGKVHSWLRITKTGAADFVLDVDDGFAESVIERLSRFMIRTKATIEPLEWSAVAVRGDDPIRAAVDDGTWRLPLTHERGYDLLGPDVSVPDGAAVVDPAEIDAARILDGVPRMGAELTDDTIPAEIGQWIIDASVSFTKGCYVGQELVARIDSRGGNVPRRLRALVLDGPVAPGDPVEVDGPTSVVTSFAVTSQGPVALAFVGRKAEPGDVVSVGGVSAVVRELPLCATDGS